MGPPPFGGGNLGERCLGWHGDLLQWGHRLSAVETVRYGAGFVCCYGASMGPPPFGGGNLVTAMVLVQSVSLQWGHRLSAVETVRLKSRRCVIDQLQWGHRLSAVETICWGQSLRRNCRCFNGATAFRRWKPPWTPPACSIPAGSFNGATAFRRWKQHLEELGAVEVAELQWGHRLSAVETRTANLEPTYDGELQWGHRLSAVETRLTKEEGEEYG